MTYAASSPAATSSGPGNTPPVCQNCQTSTTPLWRRDEIGSVLCNACGLFLKLHGRPRPISLKTDVIKSRNRVKTAGQGAKKKSLFDGTSTLHIARSDAGTPPLPSITNQRRLSNQKPATASSGGSDRSNSPISRINTPTLHPPSHFASHSSAPNSNIAPQHLFDNVTLSFNSGPSLGLTDPALHHSPSLPSLHINQPSPGSASSLTDRDRHLEPPQTYEDLRSQNTSLKTRVNELEVINDLFKGRVSELEQADVNARRAEIAARESESRLRRSLNDAYQREDDLKRRVSELEARLMEKEDAEDAHRSKRARVEGETPQT